VQRGEIQVVDDHDVATASAEHQLIARGRNPTTHQTAGVKNSLRDQALFRLRVDVPGEDAAIEAGADE